MAAKKRYSPKIERALSLYLKLMRAHDTLYLVSGDHIRTFGLTPMQFNIIEALGHLGPMLMGDLTRKQFTTGGNITVVVNNLVDLGLVKRVPSKEDKRAYYVHLTPKGTKLFKKVFKPQAEFIASVVSVLNDSEQEQLARLLKKLGTGVAEKFNVNQ